MYGELKFETFKEFIDKAERIIELFNLSSFLPFFSLKEYKNYVYNEHKFSNDKTKDELAKDTIWQYLMSYKYEEKNFNDLKSVYGLIKKG